MSQESKLGTTQFTTLFFFIMSKQVLISLLAQGNNGAEILSILDTLTAENVSDADDTEGSGSVIDF